jgi:hypothetical protein
MGEDDRLSAQAALTLKGVGITILGVILSVGATIAFGLRGPWWARLLAGAATTVALATLVKFASRGRRGPLTRLANWIVGAPDP